MRLLVAGIGAMGSLFAARLAPHAAVTMLGHWPAQVDAIRRKGILLQELDGRRSTRTVAITDDPGEIGPVDGVLVLVKSTQTARTALELAALFYPPPRVLTLQNGLGNREKLAAALPATRLTQGSTAQGATLIRPGWVRHAGNGETTLARGDAFWADLLTSAGFPISLSEAIDGVIWGKLVVNAGINPLTALLQKPNGYLVENETARACMARAAGEAAAVARRLGIPLPFADPAAAAAAVARATASNHSSMWQDLARGARSEIEAITGEIVARGRALGVPTPVNEYLLEAVRTRERSGRPSAPLAIEAIRAALVF